jgi:Ca2+-binding RTX toxin-like protein
MTDTDTQNRGTFMLGGTGDDTLTGGTKADLLVGNAGNDSIFCATKTDRKRWRTVVAIVSSSKAANDESIYTRRNAA